MHPLPRRSWSLIKASLRDRGSRDRCHQWVRLRGSSFGASAVVFCVLMSSLLCSRRAVGSMCANRNDDLVVPFVFIPGRFYLDTRDAKRVGITAMSSVIRSVALAAVARMLNSTDDTQRRGILALCQHGGCFDDLI